MATATETLERAGPAVAGGAGPEPRELADRLYSLDVFRGFTMVWMISEGFGLRFYKDSPVLGGLAAQFTHADWHGFYPWDLIQPFFMFIVGVAMPFSFSRRAAADESWSAALPHVLKRCALLLLLGTFARSLGRGEMTLDVINVLGQLSFTYLVAYLVLPHGWRVQLGASVALLAVHTAIYQFVSLPGVTGPWDKNANAGWVLDSMIFGKNWGGGYATINCISSAANTIWGVMAGYLLMSRRTAGEKLRLLALIGAGALLLGLGMDQVIPSIKKIWTASFAVYSLGYTLLALAVFYWVFDIQGWRKAGKIFAIVGANSIFIYLFHEILHRWLNQSSMVFFKPLTEAWGPFGFMLNAWAVIAFEVWVCWWLYQRRIFFKL